MLRHAVCAAAALLLSATCVMAAAGPIPAPAAIARLA